MTESLNNIDLPVEAGASRKTLWLVVAVGLVLVGAVGWFRFNVATSTPPEARAVATAFLHGVANGDYDAARQLCDPTLVDLSYIKRSAADYRGSGGIKSESAMIGMGRSSKSSNSVPTAEFSQEIHFATFMKTLSVTVKQIDGTWKVTSFSSG